QTENNEWQEAGQITLGTMLELKKNHPTIAQRSTMYFGDIPIKHSNAWVFPVGLSDALWFLYRDQTLNVVSKDTNVVKQLYKYNKKQKTANVYFFYFDQEGNVLELK